MFSSSSRSDRYGLMATVLVATAALLIHASGWLEPIDRWIGDRLQNTSDAPMRTSFLLIQSDRELTGGEQQRLEKTLLEMGAASVSQVPVQHSQSTSESVVRQFPWGQEDQKTWSVQHYCEGAVSRAGSPPPNARIRFCKSLPRLNASQVLANDLVPELVENQFVLVDLNGSQAARYHAGTVDGRSMDGLEYHGQICRCLIAGDWIRPVGWWANAGFAVLASVLFVQLFRTLSCKWWLYALVLGLESCWLIKWACCNQLNLELSMMSMVAPGCLSYTLVTRQRFDALHAALDRRYSQTQSNVVRVASSTTTEDTSTDAWKQTAHAWRDLFGATRVALLQLNAGETYLSVRAMAGADETDIGERRRDITRMPYRDAVDQKMAMRLDTKIFFTVNETEARAQFAVPMIADRTIGVVMIEIDADRLSRWESFDEQALRFAGEVASFLSSNHSGQPNGTRRQSRWMPRPELPEHTMAASIAAAQSADQNSDGLWMRAFNQSNNPLAVCDLFGRIVQSNHQMVALLQESGLSTEGFDAITWLQQITGRTMAECGDTLRACLLQRSSERIHCHPAPGQTLAPIIVLSPLARESDDQGHDQNHFDAAQAISLELISPAPFSKAADWEMAFQWYQRDKIAQRVAECQQTGNEPDAYDAVLSDIGELVSLCQQSRSTLAEDMGQWVPISLADVLPETLQACRQRADLAGTTLQLECPSILPICGVNPFAVKRVLDTLLNCVLDDAVAGDRINFRLVRHDAGRNRSPRCESMFEVEIHSTIQSFAQLSEPLSEPLSDGDSRRDRAIGALTPELADQFRMIGDIVRQWGGEIDISCSDDFRIAVQARWRIFGSGTPLKGPTLSDGPTLSEKSAHRASTLGAGDD